MSEVLGFDSQNGRKILSSSEMSNSALWSTPDSYRMDVKEDKIDQGVKLTTNVHIGRSEVKVFFHVPTRFH